MWVLRGLLNTQFRHVGLESRARMGAWHADPIKTIKTVGFFLSDGVYSDRGSVKVNCLWWVLTEV